MCARSPIWRSHTVPSERQTVAYVAFDGSHKLIKTQYVSSSSSSTYSCCAIGFCCLSAFDKANFCSMHPSNVVSPEHGFAFENIIHAYRLVDATLTVAVARTHTHSVMLSEMILYNFRHIIIDSIHIRCFYRLLSVAVGCVPGDVRHFQIEMRLKTYAELVGDMVCVCDFSMPDGEISKWCSRSH